MNSLQEWIEKLQATDKLILVEGKKDKEALAKLGITNITTVSQKPIYQIVESILLKKKEVIILTDFDAEGRRLYSRLYRQFQQYGIKVDNTYRIFLIRKTRISHIEGIASYAARSIL